MPNGSHDRPITAKQKSVTGSRCQSEIHDCQPKYILGKDPPSPLMSDKRTDGEYGAKSKKGPRGFSRFRSGSLSANLFLSHATKMSSTIPVSRSVGTINTDTTMPTSALSYSCSMRSSTGSDGSLSLTSSSQSNSYLNSQPVALASGKKLQDYQPVSFEAGSPVSMRMRSGSFNAPTSTEASDRVFLSPPVFMSRDRSLHDISSHGSSSCDPSERSRHSVDLFENELFGGVYLGPDGMDDFEEINCLLPNGIIMDLSVHPDDEIIHIKQLVLNRATADERLPLRGCLNPDGSHYILTYVTHSGRIETCYDETKTLRELKPFQNLLKFGKRVKNEGLYRFKSQIGKLIGKNLKDFDDLRNPEVNDFRWRVRLWCNTIAQERRQRLKESWEARIVYQFPPRLVTRPRHSHCAAKLSVRLTWQGREAQEIAAHMCPQDLLLDLALGFGFSEEKAKRSVIKVIGEDSYLVGPHRMIDFEYIWEQVNLDRFPKLAVLAVDSIGIVEANDSIYQSLEENSNQAEQDRGPSISRNPSLTAQSFNPLGLPLHSTMCSTSVNHSFAATVKSLEIPKDYLKNGPHRSLYLQMGLYHGTKLLSPHINHPIKQGSHCPETGLYLVDVDFHFGLLVSQLPRASKICMGLYDKRRSNNVPLFWVNSNIFDFKGKLKWKNTFHMWRYSPGSLTPTHQQLLPLGPNMGNPNMSEAAHLVASFQNGDVQGWVEYPCELIEIPQSAHDLLDNNNHVGTITKFYTQELRNISSRDPFHNITEQEKDLIWKLREYCLTQIPDLLPRVIDCVDYTDYVQVCILNHLLLRWPLLPVEKVLLLLDYAYPDEHVRKYAVKCLRMASDDVILRYLPQLSQALKHECYFQNGLMEFLLERALNNQHIGHDLFWKLKAEMNSPSVSLMYGLVLEAYLSAAPEHMKILQQQSALGEKCKATQSALDKFESSSRHHDKAERRFQASIKAQFDGHHPYVNFVCPLNPGVRCGRIQVEACKLMNSKMKPQMLVFKNLDANHYQSLTPELVDDIVMIYKKGDDLRQDQLTLQLLKVMDTLWKQSGLDLRLNVYRCLATDLSEGFIEVVQSAETICRIQMTMSDYRTTSVFRRGLLVSWLKKHNHGEEAMRRAQWEFTQSCAGYSVATYILGIGDRHNDNIMLKKNGQMFHIDFGHFLGNFKHKFGFRRERVPMVLSSEFVDVISSDCGLPGNFEVFRALCEESFLAIRKHGALIISLLAMMISTGLPELSSEQDLNVIRTTLHLDRSEEYALEHFRKDFNESLRNAWTISLDWSFHMVNQLRDKGVKGQ